jgi:hypothetical protein
MSPTFVLGTGKKVELRPTGKPVGGCPYTFQALYKLY